MEPEYLLGLSTEVGAGELERFLVFFFWEDSCAWLLEFLSGDDGLDFFLAGEFEGDGTLSLEWVGLSKRRLGLLMPFSISLMLGDSSCESGGGGECEVSMGTGGSVEGSSEEGGGSGFESSGSGIGVLLRDGIGVLDDERVRSGALTLEEIGMMIRREFRKVDCVRSALG